jgi:hypothetical protein
MNLAKTQEVKSRQMPTAAGTAEQALSFTNSIKPDRPEKLSLSTT